MAIVYEKSKGLTDVELHYCPGCNHGIIHRLVAEVIDEMNLDGKVVGVVRNPKQVPGLLELGVYTDVIVADCTKPVEVMEAALAANDGKEYDLSICCVNIESCEMSAILPVHDDGLVYFFSMATSFTKAALGAEGIGKDVTMIIGNGYTKNHAQITLDVLREKFLCNLEACKGECCIEGDAGAPVEFEEIEKLEEVLPVIWDELSAEARAVIEAQGVVYTDEEGDLVTSIVNNKDCVFTCYDEKGCCYCAIEKAFREGKTDFYKPVSCHLYPIRIGDYGPYKAVNYHRWDVCKAAVLLGRKEDVPVYKFLKEPLIRKFGEEWYAELELAAGEMKKQGML